MVLVAEPQGDRIKPGELIGTSRICFIKQISKKSVWRNDLILLTKYCVGGAFTV